MATVKFDEAMSVYTVSQPPGCPKLRLVKVASTPFAQPGDVVDFTIRFDNLGNEPLDHVVIVDSLSPRLEYVSDAEEHAVQRRRPLLDRAQSGRLAGGPLRLGPAAAARPRRHPPLPVPRAVDTTGRSFV